MPQWIPSRHRSTVAGLVLMIAGSGCAPDASDPGTALSGEAGAVVQQVLDAYGGRGRIELLETLRSEGSIEVPSRDQSGTLVRHVGIPGRLRIEIRYPDYGEVRIARGNLGWVGSDDRNLRPTDGTFLGSMRLEAARLGLLSLLARGDNVTLSAPDDEGRSRVRIEVDPTLTLDLHIHPKSHLVERVVQQFAGLDTLRLVVDLAEHRWVDGIRVPFREDLTVNGEHVSTYRMKSVVVDPRLPRDLFGPR